MMSAVQNLLRSRVIMRTNPYLGIFITLAGAGMMSSVHAQSVTMDLTTPFNIFSSTTAGDLTASFQDVPGGVDLTLSASGMPAGLQVQSWWFNLDSSYAENFLGPLTFTLESHSAGMTLPNISYSEFPEYMAGSVFPDVHNNFNVQFSLFSGFVSGDSITYLITSPLSPSAIDFDLRDSTTPGIYMPGSYYSAAEIAGGFLQGAYDLGADSADVDYNVPDGGCAAFLLGLALTGLGLTKHSSKVQC
jgi:hypothetical protein